MSIAFDATPPSEEACLIYQATGFGRHAQERGVDFRRLAPHIATNVLDAFADSKLHHYVLARRRELHDQLTAAIAGSKNAHQVSIIIWELAYAAGSGHPEEAITAALHHLRMQHRHLVAA